MSRWTEICALEDITPGTGACALLNNNQVAIFRVGLSLYAIDNHDPFGNASVLSRGIIGNTGDEIYVASPLYKQRFNLKTGQCLDDDTVIIKTYSIRENKGKIELAA